MTSSAGNHTLSMMSRSAVLSLLLSALAGCAGQPFVDAPSRNQNSRINFLVIHFTTENFADSMDLLTKPSDNPVSSHYLIPEPYDPSYGERALRVFRLVDESRRAWHAGKSYWNGEESLNDRSIGIELVNRSYCVDDTPEDDTDTREYCVFPDFADEQITLLIRLAEEILARYPEIDPTDIVGHADVAPQRKVDPGPRFPWQHLYRAGVGAWYDDETMLEFRRRFAAALPPISSVQRALHAYGYPIEETGIHDDVSRRVVSAFQMHFRPTAVHGAIDTETAAVLFALIAKYRADQLGALLDVPPAGELALP